MIFTPCPGFFTATLGTPAGVGRTWLRWECAIRYVSCIRKETLVGKVTQPDRQRLSIGKVLAVEAWLLCREFAEMLRTKEEELFGQEFGGFWPLLVGPAISDYLPVLLAVLGQVYAPRRIPKNSPIPLGPDQLLIDTRAIRDIQKKNLTTSPAWSCFCWSSGRLQGSPPFGCALQSQRLGSSMLTRVGRWYKGTSHQIREVHSATSSDLFSGLGL